MEQAVASPVAADEVDLAPMRPLLGFLLRIAQLKVFDHYYQELGPAGIKPGEFTVLVLIGHNPNIRQGVLARRLLIKPAHMTKLVRVLEDAGHVTRNIPDRDRRAVELSLTPAGKAHLARHAPLFFGNEARLQSRLTSSEADHLRQLLCKFAGLEQGEMP